MTEPSLLQVRGLCKTYQNRTGLFRRRAVEAIKPLSFDLEVGQTLLLNVGPEARIHLRCGGVGLLAGRMGRVGHQVAVRVENQFRDHRVAKGA